MGAARRPHHGDGRRQRPPHRRRCHQGNAEAIVTDNVRDFPNQALEPWGLHAISTSDFLLDLLDLSQGAVIGALIEMSDKRKNPPLTVDQILDSLELCPSVAFVREVRAIIDNGS